MERQKESSTGTCIQRLRFCKSRGFAKVESKKCQRDFKFCLLAWKTSRNTR